jgi:hypothetical protein
MKPALLLAIIASSFSSVFGGELVITSPDHARTFAYGEMTWRQLYVDRASGVLAARITFSNLPYVSGSDPRADESFDFRFPGVQADCTHHAHSPALVMVNKSRSREFKAVPLSDQLISRPAHERKRPCDRGPDRDRPSPFRAALDSNG